MTQIQPITLDAIKLRSLQAGDLPAFNAIYTDPTVRKYAHSQSEQPLTKFFLLTHRPPWELMVIERIADSEIIGWCGLSLLDNTQEQDYEIEIFLSELAQGTGVGTSALNELLRIARTHGRGAQAQVHVENSTSQRLMRKLRWELRGVNGVWQIWRAPSP